MRAKYVLSEVMVGLWRNVTMTIAMIITMAVSLTMLGASLVMYKQIDEMKARFVGNVQVSIFLTTTTTEASPDFAAIKTAVYADPHFKSGSITFVSQTQALEEFRSMHSADSPEIVGLVTADELPPSFRVKLKNTSDYAAIAKQYKAMPGVDNVVDQAQLLNKVFKVLGALQSLALVLAIAQGLAALLLVANTIQVAAYSKRREVAVMKLVGASNWFIQSPFVLEAMFAGTIGAILAWIGLVSAKFFLIDKSLSALNALLGEVQWSTINLMLPLLVAAGAIVSGITGWITLRAYIKK
jgi:cell division transport system permease protein